MAHQQPTYIKDEHLETYASDCAHRLKLSGRIRGRSAAMRLQQTLRELERIHEAAALQWQSLAAMPGAVRWLLDNHYLAAREGTEAVQTLMGAGELRCGAEEPFLLSLARAMARADLWALKEERMERFLQGFQRNLVLTRAELSLLSAGLRWALIERLTERCRSAFDSGDWADCEGELAHIFTSLRFLASRDLTELLDSADFVERCYRADPAGIYPLMDDDSRAHYRGLTARLARRRGISEYKAARLVLSLAKHGKGQQSHVGYWLLREPLGARPLPKTGGSYMAALLLATLFFSLLCAFLSQSAGAFFLLLLPVSEVVKGVLDFLLLRLSPTAQLPRLALKDGVPPEGRTLCVVSCLLTGEDDGKALAQRLEEYRLCSRDCGGELRFALLADLPDTTQEVLPGSELWLQCACEAIEALNDTYGGGFFLLTRSRVKTEEGRYMGWERKRGALWETACYLRGRPSGIVCAAGDADALENTQYLLTLDSDTRLPPEAARLLIGAALHPLNRPQVDPARRLVTAGHGILSPRLSVTLSSATHSDFSRVFSPPGGSDPYSSVCGSVYMDAFTSGGFAGKGLLHIDSFLTCLDGRIPPGRVLSHDALEGAFLRAGYDSRTELLEGFPSTPLSYYKRQHRWVRGDWQNLPWLLGRGRGLPEIERFRLFDSLRRSLLPVMELAGLCAACFFPSPGTIAAAAGTLLAVLFPLLLDSVLHLFRPEEEFHRRFFSPVFTGPGGSLVRALLGLLFLPLEAFFSLDAMLRALWRMGVSHKQLLQWQTAGQSDRLKGGAWALYAAAWPLCVLSAGLLLFGTVLGKAAGLLWALSPLYAYLLGLPRRQRRPPTPNQHAYLLSCARETWRYFEDFLTEEDHFLPPDNYQARPHLGLAHRTSPTNIGLALLSLLAARDLELTEEAPFLATVEHMLSSIEALEKWKGHLYNWYDTQTLRPLTPRYVSTVDSGNLCACLTALAAGLREHGREDLAARAEELTAPMSFRPLYDEKRRLFHIGRDMEKGELSDAYYDLLASEARLTAYLAVARGDVPRQHWRRLSRAQLRKNGHQGMASWTGTMFEYLMPELLLPLYRESLLYEAVRFCLFVQRKRHRPWGISESSYYALDPAMNYRYKAHGCAALALKPGMDAETVLSPYSTFLTLPLDVPGAVANLKRLEQLGMRGDYGFWEALDLSDGRQGGVVHSVMAHHQGMSLVAVANCLCGDVMCRRFMAHPAMRAYDLLLQEKLPLGGVVLRRKSLPVPARPRPAPEQEEVPWLEEVDFRRPAATALASPVYSLLATESGRCRALWGQLSPYLPAESPLDELGGVLLFLRLNGEEFPLLPSVRDSDAVRRRCQLGSAWARWQSSFPSLHAEVLLALPRDEAGEQRTVQLNWSGPDTDAELVLRFMPLLASYNDYRSHPAFAKLGLSARVRQGQLLLQRLPRGRQGALYLALSTDRPCRFENVPGADAGRCHFSRVLEERDYFFTEPLCECRVPLHLERGSELSCYFALGMGHSAEAAAAAAAYTLALEEEQWADLPQRAAAVLGMGAETRRLARQLLPSLWFPPAPSPGPHRQEELWKFGISGDRPILCAEYTQDNQLEAARRLLDCHLLLSGCGMEHDLVFISHDGASYHKPLNDAISALLWRSGGEVLDGAEGGVHLVEHSGGAAGLRACAAAVIDLEAPAPPRFRDTTWRPLPAERRAVTALPQNTFANGAFRFRCDGALPPRSWSHVLSNGRLGFLATDCGSGNLWHLNARENPISPWDNQPLATQGPERLVLESGQTHVSLFAAPDGRPCLVSYRPGSAQWEKRIGQGLVRTRCFIPPHTDARVLLVESEGLADDAMLCWELALQLGPQRGDGRFVQTAERGGVLYARNDRAMAAAEPVLALAFPSPTDFTCDGGAAASGDYDGSAGCHARSVFAFRLPLSKKAVIVCGCGAEDALRALAEPAAAEAALAETERFWRAALPLSLRSPAPALDTLMNGFLGYQALCCRLLGRCSLYQSGGAYGFRDQLQDAVNLLLFDPRLAREQILRCCERQYREGDVQHWWHEGGETPRGVRTRCSDDLLWLPWALCEYAEKTGDRALCCEQRPYLLSPELLPRENDRYEAAEASAEQESVLRHAARAMDLVLRRGVGEHGLLGMGSGDWNDGFDRVGGESVWLTWFFCSLAPRFAELLEQQGGDGGPYRAAAERLLAACESAWDGAWYRRGYFADGSPLGSRESECCRIDSIAQSFAAFCPSADRGRVEQALTSAVDALFDQKHALVKLFTPPFDDRGPDPGYIAAYGPGFRENGGQYTHAAVWLVMALLRTRRTDEAWALLSALLPGEKDPAVYQAEPYVIAADVYTAPGHEGEAGWSWYTGSAGWLLRVVLEELLGLQLSGGKLRISPRLPSHWSGCAVEFRGHRIVMEGGAITVDGKAYHGEELEL